MNTQTPNFDFATHELINGIHEYSQRSPWALVTEIAAASAGMVGLVLDDSSRTELAARVVAVREHVDPLDRVFEHLSIIDAALDAIKEQWSLNIDEEPA